MLVASFILFYFFLLQIMKLIFNRLANCLKFNKTIILITINLKIIALQFSIFYNLIWYMTGLWFTKLLKIKKKVSFNIIFIDYMIKLEDILCHIYHIQHFMQWNGSSESYKNYVCSVKQGFLQQRFFLWFLVFLYFLMLNYWNNTKIWKSEK